MEKPTVKLIGEDGNAFAIIGACMKAARKAGWSAEKQVEIREKMMAGDYDNLLQVALEYFDVE